MITEGMTDVSMMVFPHDGANVRSGVLVNILMRGSDFCNTYELSFTEALPEEDARRSDDVVQHSAVLDQRIQRLFKLRDYLLLSIGYFRWVGSG